MTARPPAPALTASEAAIVVVFDAAPVPPEVVAAGERVETVARAIADASDPYDPRDWADYMRDAAAAIAADPSPAEEAVKRVEALADEHAAWIRTNRDLAFRFATQRAREAENFHLGMAQAQEASARRIRAALASPAPAPQGEEPTCYCGRLGHRLGGPILHKRTEECPR